MNGRPTQEKSDERCLIEAAAWRTRLTESGLDSDPELDVWLAADERHRAAWDQVQLPWDFIGEHETSPEVLELRRIAITHAREAARTRWIASGSAGAEDAVRTSRERSGRRGARILVSSVVALCVAAVALTLYVRSGDVYRTQPGERRVVTLSDGSQVQLDSSTELWVRYSGHARNLTLTRGQARFDVAHDVERLFTVSASGEKVVATGTAFNVDVLPSRLVVTLIEGHVVVLPERPPSSRLISGAGGLVAEGGSGQGAAGRNGAGDRKVFAPAGLGVGRPGRGIELDAGEQLLVTPGGRSSITPANIERSTAWQTGQLVFDNEPLGSVVEQVNRYSRRPLVLEDNVAGQLRMSGVFKTSDIDGFVETLTQYLPVDADEREGTIHLKHR